MEIKAEAGGLLRLYEQIVPAVCWEELGGVGGQIYTLPVVVEMMLLQRLSERGTQQEAVQALVGGRLDGLLQPGTRVQSGKISSNTGGYARACGRVTVGDGRKNMRSGVIRTEPADTPGGQMGPCCDVVGWQQPAS
jgi:hypothetical protein